MKRRKTMMSRKEKSCSNRNRSKIKRITKISERKVRKTYKTKLKRTKKERKTVRMKDYIPINTTTVSLTKVPIFIILV